MYWVIPKKKREGFSRNNPAHAPALVFFPRVPGWDPSLSAGKASLSHRNCSIQKDRQWGDSRQLSQLQCTMLLRPNWPIRPCRNCIGLGYNNSAYEWERQLHVRTLPDIRCMLFLQHVSSRIQHHLFWRVVSPKGISKYSIWVAPLLLHNYK